MAFQTSHVSMTGVLTISLLLGACAGMDRAADTANSSPEPMDSLVSTAWLSANISDPDLVILDCTVVVEQDETGVRTRNGRSSYEAGHIPGAGFADLMEDLADPDSAYDNAMPTPERFVAAMERLGISDTSRVVLYDANYTVWAARVWWMLRWIGFDRAAVLDGGLAAWKAEGRPLATESPAKSRGSLTLSLRPEIIAGRDEVFASLNDPGVRIIDSLTDAHYRGDVAMYARPGHIPGAVNVPAFALLDETGRFRTRDELDMLLEGDRESRQITYCGGGVAASANAFVLHRLGYRNVAVYAASLQEWAADPRNPMTTGSEP